jgi:F5/8 type C domain/beta-N-acetylglucosaminidase
MNQAAASKVAIFGFADFTWNDRAYDRDRNWREAMRYLAGDDPAATEALLVFGDLNHMAPTFGAQPWQPQAPELASRVDAFWSAWKAGDQRSALTDLRGYADQIASAPEVIRGGAVGDAFVSDAAPWLDATNLWGASLQRMLDALEAGLDGDREQAEQLAAESEDLMAQAEEVRVDPPDNRWGRARVRIADGVLDTFLVAAGEVVENPMAAGVPAKVVYGEDGSATLPIEVRNRLAGAVEDVTLEAVLADGGTVSPDRVDLGAMDNGDAQTTDVELSWPSTGAREAQVETTLSWSSADGAAHSAEASDQVEVTCAAEPTTPTAVTYVDSEETSGEDGAASNAIDGDPSTIWHTAWSSGNPPHPHEIQLDLGSQRDVCGLRYLPRQTGSNGRVADYEIYLSDDGENWGEPVATGTFSDDSDEQWAPLPETSARYVRFVALNEVNGNPWASAAEISVDAR